MNFEISVEGRVTFSADTVDKLKKLRRDHLICKCSALFPQDRSIGINHKLERVL